MRRGLFLIISVVAGLFLALACSSDDDLPNAHDAAPDVGDASGDNKRDVTEPDPLPPPDLPAGWQLERRYQNTCGFYVPTSKDVLPSPLSWESCPAFAKPDGVSCRLLANPPGAESKPPLVDAAWFAGNGVVLIGLHRTAKPQVNGSHWLVAEADGPVRSAILTSVKSLCANSFGDVFGSRYTLRVALSGASSGGGFVGSNIDDLTPQVAVHIADSTQASVYAGPFAVIALRSDFSIEQYSWSDGSALPKLWSAAQDSGLDQGSFTPASDALFWAANNLNFHKVKVYTPGLGVRDFLSAGLVIDHGFDDLGTDGRDLVWIEAKGRKSGDLTPYDAYDITTAPYTTDPTKLAPRRLRSEDGPALGVDPFVVGCGYAARSNGYHTRVVRLSDGRSWLLESGGGLPWSWGRPLAITCDEVFAHVGVKTDAGFETRFARVRLDSLGQGVAPD